MQLYGIVILNYNTFEDTIACVDSIFKYTKKQVNFVIYIVDNASADNSGRKLRDYYEKEAMIKVLLSDKNLGFSGGNNIGIKEALEDKCEVVFLLNSDIILMNDIFFFMIEQLNESDEIVAVGPSIYNRTNQYVQFARKGITIESYFLDKMIVNTLFRRRLRHIRFLNYNKEENFVFEGMVSGCCFGLKRSFIEEIHFLDDNLFMYYEEDALSHIIEDKKKKTAIAAKAKIIHNEGSATRKEFRDKLLFTRMYRWTSSLYVLRKYAKASWFISSLIAIVNLIIWRLLSINNTNYRTSYHKFFNETKRVMRASQRVWHFNS